ncbi:MAG TPA: hypothetical protein VF992_09630 [Thermoplasmata archaeon]
MVPATADTWELWRGASAAIAFVLIVLLLVRHVFEVHLRASVRRALDLVAAPLFALFALYVVTDFLRTA